ncbi:MAG: UDP-glucose/GDP-mannose dehydrogenase family protein, partial [Clostridia bacterium]|nr:UDP-glucose/GDP-mannose dehydrogenase family protein [Clostridia bacterium]
QVNGEIFPLYKNDMLQFSVVSNPEFLKEGDAINDFLKPDRVVLGVDEEGAKDILRELYEPFCRKKDRIIFMSVRSAEMTKYAANSMLATRISFMNELSRLCEKVGADIHEVRTGIGSDSRIGNAFLFPGCGYGGSCFPKDVKAIIRTAHSNGMNLKLLEAVEKVNDEQKEIVFQKVFDRFNGELEGKTFGIWGLSFKPKTDDMREAPSRVIIGKIIECGGKVKVFDPEAMDEAKRIFADNPDIEYCENMYDACKDSNALILVTEWMEFRTPDFDKIKTLLKEPVIFDGRNQYNPERTRKRGFEYYCIGRKGEVVK